MITSPNIQTKADLNLFLSSMIEKLGLVFHPDDPIKDYVCSNTNAPSFSPDEVPHFEKLLDESFVF